MLKTSKTILTGMMLGITLTSFLIILIRVFEGIIR
jgi:hypothetical protein